MILRADYFTQAINNLTQRSLRTWLTMIGIFIGVALVVGLISLGQGMQEAIIGQFSSLGTNTITIQAAGGGFGPPGTFQSVFVGTEDLDDIKKVSGVDESFGRLIEPVRVEIDDDRSVGYMASIPNDDDERELAIIIPFEMIIEDGRMLGLDENNGIIIGNRLADTDRDNPLRVGDKVFLNDESFRVVGILEKTGNPQFDTVFWITEEALRELTSEEEKFGLIVARVENSDDVDEVRDAIAKQLRKERGVEEGREDFTIETAQETIDSLNTILGAVKAVLIGIAAISLLVGGVGITNTMYTSVLERTREIGIMKAIGATNNDILSIFLIESGMLGLAGGTIGIGIGLSLAFLVQFASGAGGATLVEAHVSLGLILGALSFSFFVGALAGVTPARGASKMKPVEALSRG